ncbi:precorrin-8X methylmutase [Parendozoicomonas haliclonae]|uniref:Precorrin-8X methylmutase n=1 Tax=Parendozoicomonas haliclonae TaxID=1960125 RepID=A0A1X7AM22_9GAMM|nr:precorrin-8X methylmutase [Parendozoicomonas haliclonae]SMA48834.1 Precorrin-8X methylmutase [Parendozoicomonas haliclonae]
MDPMKQMTTQGRQIEESSFTIIDQEVRDQIGGEHGYNAGEWDVVRRAIHTTGDFEFAKLFQFSEDAIASGIKALRNGCPIVSDVSMIVSGLSKARMGVFGNTAHCFVSDPEVIAQATALGNTRSIQAMHMARDKGLLDGGIIAVGNAPTALLEAMRMIRDGEIKPALIIGIPVGFVSAVESKDELHESKIVPYITSLGRKGGSTLIVSSIHSLLIQAAQ